MLFTSLQTGIAFLSLVNRSNSLNDKTGWLFSLVSKGKMNDALIKALLDLADLRNQMSMGA
jgi:hypothetical protein